MRLEKIINFYQNGIKEVFLNANFGKFIHHVFRQLPHLCFRRKSSTWLLSVHCRRIFLSKLLRQGFLPTGPNRSGFWGFCKGFKRVIGYTVGWRAFCVTAPSRRHVCHQRYFFSVDTRPLQKKVGIYLRKTPAIFIYNSLMYNDKVSCFSVVDYGIIRWIYLRNKIQIRT